MFQKINLNRKYIELASFEVNHEYYSNKIPPGLDFSASVETAKFLRDYKLIAKQIDSKIFILQEVINHEGNWKPKIPIEENKVLSYFLNFNDETFQVKSKIPFHASKDEKFVILCKEPKIYNLEKLSIHKYLSGPFPINEIEENLNMYFNNQLVTNIEPPRSLKKKFYIKSGFYKVNFDDGKKIEFLWSREKIDADAFISFEISQKTDQNYKIIIPSREIYWQYEINTKYTDNLDDCIILDDLQIISFEQKENLNNQQKNIVYNSIFPVALKESYQNNLTIEKAGEKVLKLPFPELKNLTIEKDNVKKRVNKYFLTTYVNL